MWALAYSFVVACLAYNGSANELVCTSTGNMSYVCKPIEDIEANIDESENIVVADHIKASAFYADTYFVAAVVLLLAVLLLACIMTCFRRSSSISKWFHDAFSQIPYVLLIAVDFILLSISQYYYESLAMAIAVILVFVFVACLVIEFSGRSVNYKKKRQSTLYVGDMERVYQGGLNCSISRKRPVASGFVVTRVSNSVYALVNRYHLAYATTVFLAQSGLMWYLVEGILTLETKAITLQGFCWGVLIQFLTALQMPFAQSFKQVLELTRTSATSAEELLKPKTTLVSRLRDEEEVQDASRFRDDEDDATQGVDDEKEGEKKKLLQKIFYSSTASLFDSEACGYRRWRQVHCYEAFIRSKMLFVVDVAYPLFILFFIPFILAGLNGLDFVKDAFAIAFVTQLDDKEQQVVKYFVTTRDLRSGEDDIASEDGSTRDSRDIDWDE